MAGLGHIARQQHSSVAFLSINYETRGRTTKAFILKILKRAT